MNQPQRSVELRPIYDDVKLTKTATKFKGGIGGEITSQNFSVEGPVTQSSCASLVETSGGHLPAKAR